MAVYFLLLKTFSRTKGSRITHAAAYRAGERIRDERTGESYNYSHRQDVVAKGIVLPKELAGMMDANWARDRATLWNAAERGDRRNLRLGREVLVLLPPELNTAQRHALVHRFSQNLANRYQNAVDFAVHEPRPGSDKRHHHAHLLMTTRQITPEGLGERTTLELGGRERHARGLVRSNDLFLIRERWARVTNEALRDAGLRARVDHRSYQDQGIDREPRPVIPQRIYYQEKRQGLNTPAGDDIRSRYRERVEARRMGRDALEQVVKKQNAEAHQRAGASAKQNAATERALARGALTREELNAKRRERYRDNAAEINRSQREYRKKIAEKAPSKHASGPARDRDKSSNAWLAYRERFENEAATPDNFVGKWLEFKQRLRKEEATRTQGVGRALDSGAGGTDYRESAKEGKDTDRGRGMDYE
ncbi:MAG: MobA/MobL family protein [Pseudomonadota bacterium]|nr:MobA/MobL family protein [Pseudomonadota bacterium]